ncbi:MAG: hypothetical protein AAF772_07565, partial [Acidobacteriota bacterium]
MSSDPSSAPPPRRARSRPRVDADGSPPSADADGLDAAAHAATMPDTGVHRSPDGSSIAHAADGPPPNAPAGGVGSGTGTGVDTGTGAGTGTGSRAGTGSRSYGTLTDAT